MKIWEGEDVFGGLTTSVEGMLVCYMVLQYAFESASRYLDKHRQFDKAGVISTYLLTTTYSTDWWSYSSNGHVIVS